MAEVSRRTALLGGVAVAATSMLAACSSGSSSKAPMPLVDQASTPRPGQTVVSATVTPQLADVVKALNTLGANPLELIAILQAMKASGALRAELEVI